MLIGNGIRIAFLFSCAALAGCATSRSEISIDSPVAMPSGAAVSSGRTVVIRSVKDERAFELAPDEPSTPSLGFGGSDQASAEIKSRAIGRKRNSFGKALGDILLQPGQTVEGLIRENLSAALAQAGYQVKSADAAGPSPMIMDVRIKKFWAWTQPGFWAITLAANIETDLDLSGTTSPATIDVHAEDKRAAATESAWTEIIIKALGEFRQQAAAKAGAFP